jgi:hypothetical protein
MIRTGEEGEGNGEAQGERPIRRAEPRTDE